MLLEHLKVLGAELQRDGNSLWPQADRLPHHRESQCWQQEKGVK